MFGYIRTYKPEMRVKEFEMYKAVYCTLCKQLGKNYGVLARLTLSYDFTFLALLGLSLEDAPCGTVRKRCAFNPLKKCNYCEASRSEFDLCAAAAMIMLYYKIDDNIRDEKGIKKFGYRLIKALYTGSHKKAARQFPEIDKIMFSYICEQCETERLGVFDADRAADPTAKALSQLFELLSRDAAQKRVLNRIGYCMGRYIYILDAAADWTQDKKKNSYNPFADKSRQEMINCATTHVNLTVGETKAAFELLDIYKFRDILGNIIYLGMEETAKTVLQNDKKEKSQ